MIIDSSRATSEAKNRYEDWLKQEKKKNNGIKMMNITRRRMRRRIKRANKHGSLKQKEAVSEKLHQRKSCSEDDGVLRRRVSLSGKEVRDNRRCPDNAGDNKRKPVSSLSKWAINTIILDFLPRTIEVAKALGFEEETKPE